MLLKGNRISSGFRGTDACCAADFMNSSCWRKIVSILCSILDSRASKARTKVSAPVSGDSDVEGTMRTGLLVDEDLAAIA